MPTGEWKDRGTNTRRNCHPDAKRQLDVGGSRGGEADVAVGGRPLPKARASCGLGRVSELVRAPAAAMAPALVSANGTSPVGAEA